MKLLNISGVKLATERNRQQPFYDFSYPVVLYISII